MPSGYALTVLADHPVGYWRLGDSGVPVIARDIGGLNHGTPVNTPTYGTTGALTGDSDDAMTFARASEEHITVADAAVLDPGDTFTLEAWIKKASNGNDAGIISKQNNGYHLNIAGADNTLHLDQSNVGTIVASTVAITDTNWHHVCATKSGATVKLYIDGVDRTGAVTNRTIAANAYKLLIGCDGTADAANAAWMWDGSIDEVAIYATALSAAQVLAHYNAGLAAPSGRSYALQVDWNADGSMSGTYDDVTGDTLSVDCRRGRDYASQVTGRSTAGQLMAVLRNTDALYSPFYASGALYGSILPGRVVRLVALYPTTGILWTGVLNRIQPQTRPGPEAVATLYALGTLIKLSAGKRVSPAANSGAATGTIVAAILTEAGIAAADQIVDTGITTTGRWYVEDKPALDAVREIEETELGFFFERCDGRYVYEDRHHRLKSDHLTSQATFSDAGAAARPYTAIEEQDPLREIFNEVQAVVEVYTVGALAVLWTLSETPVLAAGQSRLFIAQYPNGSSGGTTGAYVDAWTTPVVGTDVTQTGVANGDIAVAVVKQARRMEITITNNHASAAATLTLVRARGTPVTKGNPTLVGAADAASQAVYGERSYRLPGPWHANTTDAQAFADYIVDRYGDVQPVITLEIAANKNAILHAEAVNREISDRVTVTATGNAKLGVNQDFFIEAIAHRLSQGGDHRTVFELSPISADGAYWVLGTSTLGETTKLGF